MSAERRVVAAGTPVAVRSRGEASEDPILRSAAREPEDDRFNDEVNDLLRQAAEQRDQQLRTLAADDAARSRRALDAVLALVRDRRSEVPRS